MDKQLNKTTKAKKESSLPKKQSKVEIAMPKSSLSEEETQEIKKKAAIILSQARRQILIKYPFIGNVALRMEIIPVRDVRVRTACTDGCNIFFDIAFLSSLSAEEQQFVLAHEIMHAVMMHLVRRGTRIPELFNIATDKEINYILKNDGFLPPSDLCFPTSNEEGKCAEEIYELMLKDLKNMKKKSKGNASGDSKDSKPEDGNKNGKLQGQFDKHVYEGGSSNGNGEGNEDGAAGSIGQLSDKYGDVGFDKDYKLKVPKDFADKMREIIISEAQRTEQMRGVVPGCVKEMIKKITEPEIKWQEVLAQFVTKCYKSGNRSWIPPNRRHIHNGIYLQSRSGERIKLAAIIDTSGSTMGDRGKFLGELNSLIRSFGDFSLFIVECDADVGSIQHFTQDDDLENIINNGEYEMTGGGGTAMLPAFEAIIDKKMDVDAIICLTDGYIDNIPENPTKIPTLWVITKNGTEDFCDWGQKIKLQHNDDE